LSFRAVSNFFFKERFQWKIVTNWRLKKHVKKMHSNPRLKQCYYFKNDMQCPFDDLGCKFGHDFDTQMQEKCWWFIQGQGDCLAVKNEGWLNHDEYFFCTNKFSKCDDCLDEVLKHLNKDEDMRTWPPDRLLRCLALSAWAPSKQIFL
jgi:hypothetical protein